ncbi:DUF86 domain-containing protein [Tissierella praeacuta]|uniref:type VII toxin-antitoxin system HepT family RNase toxin n=1 Tax=Tissierella praeacuta TaxID=43131 RepID=UPI003341FB77
MTKDISDVIKRKLKELEQNLIYLKQISYDVNLENLKSDMIKYWGIERGIQICIERIIDIANIIISVSDKEKPDTYREIMLMMSDLEVVSGKFSKKLANMVGFRNILVHDYTKIDQEIILNMLKDDINDFMKYTVEVNNWMKNKGY